MGLSLSQMGFRPVSSSRETLPGAMELGQPQLLDYPQERSVRRSVQGWCEKLPSVVIGMSEP